MTRELNDKQMLTLHFIHDCIKSNDCSPTKKEIAKALSISTSSAYYRVQNLLSYGYLRESETGQWGRNIALTEKGSLTCLLKVCEKQQTQIDELSKKIESGIER
ncbi:MAG: LexA family protein [Planctomycetota bacterium]|jgi:predicted transcriptional regulator